MFQNNGRFSRFEKTVYLASPKMHGEELSYVEDAFRKNWLSTVGENVDEMEKAAAEFVGCGYGVGLSCGTAALHLAVKLAGERLYPGAKPGRSLEGRKVFCSDMTFDATVNPVVYEGGEPVFIGTEYGTWNMDPAALEKAFELYPDVKLVVAAHLYGTPGKIDELMEVIRRHGAILVEDAAESLGATYKGKQTGTFGDYNVISFNGNKIITGSSGGNSAHPRHPSPSSCQTTCAPVGSACTAHADSPAPFSDNLTRSGRTPAVIRRGRGPVLTRRALRSFPSGMRYPLISTAHPPLSFTSVAGSRFMPGEPRKRATKVSAGARYTSSGMPTCTSRPSRITAMRSPSAIASV